MYYCNDIFLQEIGQKVGTSKSKLIFLHIFLQEVGQTSIFLFLKLLKKKQHFFSYGKTKLNHPVLTIEIPKRIVVNNFFYFILFYISRKGFRDVIRRYFFPALFCTVCSARCQPCKCRTVAYFLHTNLHIILEGFVISLSSFV